MCTGRVQPAHGSGGHSRIGRRSHYGLSQMLMVPRLSKTFHGPLVVNVLPKLAEVDSAEQHAAGSRLVLLGSVEHSHGRQELGVVIPSGD